MRLIIVRHGQTKSNVKGTHQGQGHGVLSDEGIMQVRALGKKLESKKIDIIYSSDLRRAAHTAIAIAKFHKTKISYEKDLREIDLGIWEGKPYNKYNLREMSLSTKPKGGESYLEVLKRVRRFSKDLYKRHSNDTVVIVTHGVIIKCLTSIYLKIPLSKVVKLRTKNAGMLIIDVNGSRARKVKDDLFLKIK